MAKKEGLKMEHKVLIAVGVLVAVAGIIVLILWAVGVIGGNKGCNSTFDTLQQFTSTTAVPVKQLLSADGIFSVTQAIDLQGNTTELTLLKRQASDEYTVVETLTVANAGNDQVSVAFRYDGLQLAIGIPTANSNAGEVQVYYRSTVDDLLFANSPNRFTAPTSATTPTFFGRQVLFNNKSTNDNNGLFVSFLSNTGIDGNVAVYKNVNTTPEWLQTIAGTSSTADENDFGLRFYVQENTWMLINSAAAEQLYCYQNISNVWTANNSITGVVTAYPWISPDGLAAIIGDPEYPLIIPPPIQGKVSTFSRTSTNSAWTLSASIEEPGGLVNNSGFGFGVAVSPDNKYAYISGHVLIDNTSGRIYVYAMNSDYSLVSKVVSTIDYNAKTAEHVVGTAIYAADIAGSTKRLVTSSNVARSVNDTTVTPIISGSSTKIFQGCL